MPASPDLPLPSASSSSAILDCLGPAPLIPGENTAAYTALLAGVSVDVRPRGMLEEGWVRDVADLLWEARRLRRYRAALMTGCADQGLLKLLSGINVPGRTAVALAGPWAARELEAVGQVDAILNAAGLGMEHIMAQTLRVRIAEIERIERMIASVEARRAATLREIEHYREHFGAKLRRVVEEADKITDAEFEVVAPPLAQTAAQGAADSAA